MIELPLTKIIVGDRVRESAGNIKALADSIAKIGLLHPVVVDSENKLITGWRRLEAVKLLGWETVPVNVAEKLSEIQGHLKAEHDENVCRKDFTGVEASIMADRLAPFERQAAKERQREHGGTAPGKQNTGGNFTQVSPGKARDKVAAAVGKSAPTLKKVKAIRDAASKDDDFKPLLEELVRTDKVDQVHKKYKDLVKKKAAAKAVELSETIDNLPCKQIQLKPDTFYQLGSHVLYCGDTSSEKFKSTCPPAQFAFADPPYGAGVAEWDAKFYWNHDWLLDKSGVVMVTPGIVSIFKFANMTSMEYRWSVACWIDNGMTRGALGFGNWIYGAIFSHQDIHKNSQDFFKTSIKVDSEPIHKGRKPLDFVIWTIELFSKADDLVIDPFLGSGTTLFACEKTGRKCFGGEINHEYCQEIISRWQDLTGLKAVEL